MSPPSPARETPRATEASHPMRIVVTGAGGLVGRALRSVLEHAGHRVVTLTRGHPHAPRVAHWDPAKGVLDRAALKGADAIVHLAGEPIAGGRWTAEKKKRILHSRIDGTRLLSESLASLEMPPKTLVCASAIGFYGHRGDKLLDESATPGEGFLADVCQRWEAAAAAAREAGIRVVHLRIGIVLSTEGGALAEMLRPFRLGVGGVLGPGSQWMSWIGLDDLVAMTVQAIEDETLAGPVNAVAPTPVTNRTFTKTLGRVIGRPTILPIPTFAVRTVLGELADELLLASIRVDPARMREAGFAFRHVELEAALRHFLDRA